MDLSKVEQVVLARFKERGHRAGGVTPGYGMRAAAIRYQQPDATAFDQVLKGMVEKGWLKPNEARTWYFLTESGAERVKGA